MASPQSLTSQDPAPGGEKKAEQITFRFCSECSNMLYPKEDEDAHKLQFTCRTCQYTEDAQTTCVFRNVLNTSAGETAGVTQDVGSDPTVSAPSPVVCLCCGLVVYCETCGGALDRDWVGCVKDQMEHMRHENPDTFAVEEPDVRSELARLVCPWYEGLEDDDDMLEEDLMSDAPSCSDSDHTCMMDLDS